MRTSWRSAPLAWVHASCAPRVSAHRARWICTACRLALGRTFPSWCMFPANPHPKTWPPGATPSGRSFTWAPFGPAKQANWCGPPCRASKRTRARGRLTARSWWQLGAEKSWPQKPPWKSSTPTLRAGMDTREPPAMGTSAGCGARLQIARDPAPSNAFWISVLAPAGLASRQPSRIPAHPWRLSILLQKWCASPEKTLRPRTSVAFAAESALGKHPLSPRKEKPSSIWCFPLE